MRLYSIIKKPVVTEKTSKMEVENSTYTIEVAPDATKIDIKKAFSEIYWVEVKDVRILNTREKFKMSKKWTQVKRRSKKKAYVTLKDTNTKVDFSIIK